jgi:hypothetical protein
LKLIFSKQRIRLYITTGVNAKFVLHIHCNAFVFRGVKLLRDTEVPVAVSVKIAVFWNMTTFNLVRSLLTIEDHMAR